MNTVRRLAIVAVMAWSAGVAGCGSSGGADNGGAGDDAAGSDSSADARADGTASHSDGSSSDATTVPPADGASDATIAESGSDGTASESGGGNDGGAGGDGSSGGDGSAGGDGGASGDAGSASDASGEAASSDDGGGTGDAADAGSAADASDAGSAGGEGGTTDGGTTDGSGLGDGAGTGDGAADGGCGVCSGGQICLNGACQCPIYEHFCNGVCIPTSNDPNNCGGCGVQCTGATACSGGVCSTTCMPGLTACGHACVDVGSDDGNCGTCGHTCPTGQGCVNGSCQGATVVPPPAGGCAGGGAPTGVPTGGTTTCAGGLAQTTFTWALCSCSNVKISQTFLTDGYDSSQGPYAAPPHGLGGGVGLNGSLQISQNTDIYGTLWCSASTGGITTSTPTNVYEELHSGGPVSTGTFTVATDAYVAGNITGGPMAIAGTLYQPTGDTVGASTTYGALVHQPVSVPQPCCDASQLIPVGAIVTAAAASNDDAAAGLSPNLLVGGGAPQRLDLPCGSYYFTAINPGHDLTIVAHGHTAIYVAGDVTASNPLTITLDPGETLDVFVAGTINTSQTLTLGSPNYPALMRVYVGSSKKLSFSQVTHIAADFYAAYAYVQWSAPVEVFGSVYAQFFDSSQVTKIHYDRATLTDGQECGQPAAPPDAGTPQCGSCTDCANQACVNGTCGSCTSSAQCCPPLQCLGGSCGLPT